MILPAAMALLSLGKQQASFQGVMGFGRRRWTDLGQGHVARVQQNKLHLRSVLLCPRTHLEGVTKPRRYYEQLQVPIQFGP